MYLNTAYVAPIRLKKNVEIPIFTIKKQEWHHKGSHCAFTVYVSLFCYNVGYHVSFQSAWTATLAWWLHQILEEIPVSITWFSLQIPRYTSLLYTPIQLPLNHDFNFTVDKTIRKAWTHFDVNFIKMETKNLFWCTNSRLLQKFSF